MKMYCKLCGEIDNIDMRKKYNKENMTKNGYGVTCYNKNKHTFLQPLLNKEE